MGRRLLLGCSLAKATPSTDQKKGVVSDAHRAEPVLDEIPAHRARGAIRHDLEVTRALAPAEAVGQQRALVLRVSALTCGEAGHTRVAKLLDCGYGRREVRCGIVPDGGVGGKRVGDKILDVLPYSHK